MLKTIKLKYFCLVAAISLAGCAGQAYDYKQTSPESLAEPAPAADAISHEGGMGGTGQTDLCNDEEGKSKKDCQQRPLP